MPRANRQVLMRLILVEYAFNVKFVVYILVRYPEKALKIGNMRKNILSLLTGAFFWDYSGIGIPGIDGIHVLLGAIPFSE